MDELRYIMRPSDDKKLGDWMIIRERIRDLDHRAFRDTDFEARYYDVRLFADNELDKLNETLL